MKQLQSPKNTQTQPSAFTSLKPLYSSLVYGGGTVLAFVIPWLLLPEVWFIRVVVSYLGASVLLLLVVCGLGIRRDLMQSRPSRTHPQTPGLKAGPIIRRQR